MAQRGVLLEIAHTGVTALADPSGVGLAGRRRGEGRDAGAGEAGGESELLDPRRVLACVPCGDCTWAVR